MGRMLGPSGRILHGSVTFDGYHEVEVVGSQNESVHARVHRAVLLMFSGRDECDAADLTVQHINHNKLDNRLQNLCWMTASDNNQEGHGKRCKVVDNLGEHVFPSQNEASIYIGRHSGYISEGVTSNYRPTNSTGEDVDVFLESNDTWMHYERQQPSIRHWCKLMGCNHVYEFESFAKCDQFFR